MIVLSLFVILCLGANSYEMTNVRYISLIEFASPVSVPFM